MFDYQQRPSNKYRDKFDDIKWESSNAGAKGGGEQESVCDKVCIGEEGRTSDREDG